MFSEGDRIAYPIFGVGTIESIETKLVLNEEKEYYVLRFDIGRAEVCVPTSNAEVSGLRYLSDESSCHEAIRILESAPEETPDESNWNKRYRDNLEKLRTGNILDMATVIHRLAFREKRRGLSSGEKKMLSEASEILSCELKEILGGEREMYLRLMK